MAKKEFGQKKVWSKNFGQENYFLETFHLLILLNRISGSRMQNCFTQRWVWMVLQTFISWLQGGLSKSLPQIYCTPEFIKILIQIEMNNGKQIYEVPLTKNMILCLNVFYTK